MYAAGNLPDHVSRYNHKCESRWLVMCPPPPTYSVWDALEFLMYALCGAGLVAVGVMLLQTV